MSKYRNHVAKLSGLAVLALVAIGTTQADAALMSWNGTSPAPNDSTSWAGLGPDGTALGATFTATSTAGNTITGSFAGGSGLVAVAGTSWTPVVAPFVSGDTLVWAFNNGTSVGTGPLTLGFGAAVLAGGLDLQADAPGAFTAHVEALDAAGNVLGTETFTSANGAPIFVGAQDTTADIKSLVFDLTQCTGTGCDIHDFAVDTLKSINPGVTPPPTPEPGTLALLGSSLLGFAALRRRRRQ